LIPKTLARLEVVPWWPPSGGSSFWGQLQVLCNKDHADDIVRSSDVEEQGSPCSGATSTEGEVIYFFKSLNATSTSSVHSIRFAHLKILKNGRSRCPSLEMKRLSAARHTVRR